MDAERDGDLERAARNRDEFEQLTEHLTTALGLGGRVRSATSPSERARQNVTKAIRGSLQRIGEEHQALGSHLERSIRTGRYCIYDPDPSALPDWVLHER